MRESLLVSYSKGVSRVREGEREGDRGMRYIHREEGDREREQGEENRSLHASICMPAYAWQRKRTHLHVCVWLYSAGQRSIILYMYEYTLPW